VEFFEDLDELDQEVAMISNPFNDEYDDDEYREAVKRGISHDEDDDMRILDSLPMELGLPRS
jgi:hypothetical protein